MKGNEREGGWIILLFRCCWYNCILFLDLTFSNFVRYLFLEVFCVFVYLAGMTVRGFAFFEAADC